MRFVSIKKNPTVKAKKAKKAVTHTKTKGSIMATHKKKKKAHKKAKKNPAVKVRKVSHKKRSNPYKKKSYRRRSNPMNMPSMGGIFPAVKQIAFVTLGLIIAVKLLGKAPLSSNIKNFAKIGTGLALMIFVKNPIVKAIGLTVAAIGGKDALAEQWPETFAGEDEYLIAGEDDYMDGDEYMDGTNSLVNGAELMGTNNLLRGEYDTSYADSNSGMAY